MADNRISLSDDELTDVTGGLNIGGNEVSEGDMDKTLSELAATDKYSLLAGYKGALSLFGYWDKTPRQIIAGSSESEIQKIINKYIS